MFRGRFEHAIDSKGRISFPAKFREVLQEKYSDKLIITNFDSCLVAFPLEEWKIIENKARSYSMVKKEVVSFLRFFYSGASECQIDKLGRILIPNTLREFAKLEKEIIFVGMLNRVEIWSKECWEKEQALSKENFDEIRQTLADIGI